MKRCFTFLNAEISYDLLPAFPLTELKDAPTEKEWADLPGLKCFRSRKSDVAAAAADFCIKFALAEDKFFIYASCDTHSGIRMPMKDTYENWNYDNSLELFFGTEGRFHQFQVNAKGAKVYYFNSEIIPVPEGAEVCGKCSPGKWELVFSMPADVVIRDGEAAFKVVVTDMNSILGPQYYDSMNNEYSGFGVLSTKCREASPVFKGEGLKPADWELCRSMTKSAFSRLGLPVPDLSSADKIQAALHDAREKLMPEKAEMPSVDFDIPDGEIRPISGVNFGPEIAHQALYDMNDLYRELGASSMRTHDVALEEEGSRLVDTIFVFPLSHADPADPRNYYFDQTDYYFENTMAQGPEIYYRLGVSIDHAKKRFTAVPIGDFDHYAEICAGIVRHYNRGWANGHHWNIKYWEVWNEPEAKNMWAGTFDEYLDFFVIVYKRLKSEFPEIKVGGFGAISLNPALFQQMAEKCAAHGIKPDFISWHHYSANMDGAVFQGHAARYVADAVGFEEAELHLTEWHYINLGPGTPEGEEDMGGIDSAVYTAGVITGWQDTPMDLSHYYTAGVGGAYGVFDRFHRPKKVYYALCQCGALQNRYKYRVKTIQGKDGTYVIAGKDEEGKGFVMFGCFKTQDKEVSLRIDGIPADAEVKVALLDAEKTMQEIGFKRDGSIFVMPKESSSSLYIITFQ